MTKADVVVVGGGVGGVALATVLARRGRRAIVIEKKPPLVFRVGESLDWEAPIFLRKLGVEVDRLVAEGKSTYKNGAVCTNPAHEGVQAEIGFALPFRALMHLVGRADPTIHANRELVDIEIFDRAREAGVEIAAQRAKRIKKEGDRVTGVELDDGRVLEGAFYVDATGSAAMLRRAMGVEHDEIGPRKVVVRGRFAHPYDGKGTHIRTDDSLTQPAWIWDINVSHDVTDIGIVVAEEDFAVLKRKLGSLRAVFLHQVSKHADLGWLPPLVGEDAELWTCTFQDRVAHRSAGENWVAVGESAAVVDAILSSGFTSALRAGFNAAEVVDDALSRGARELCPTMRGFYHRKIAAHVRTIDGLIDVLWYRGRMREQWPLLMNVMSILFFNFNLNHIHTRWVPKSEREMRLLERMHRGIDAFVPRFDRAVGALGKVLRRPARVAERDPLVFASAPAAGAASPTAAAM